MEREIRFFDTTLRDGEQTPGVHFDAETKVTLARRLEDFGAAVVEAGFPASSPGDAEAVRRVAEALERAEVAALARCRAGDIDAAAEALARLQAHQGWYDPAMLADLATVTSAEAGREILELRLQDVKLGMIFVDDVRTAEGTLLVARGQVSRVAISELVLQRTEPSPTKASICSPSHAQLISTSLILAAARRSSAACAFW